MREGLCRPPRWWCPMCIALFGRHGLRRLLVLLLVVSHLERGVHLLDQGRRLEQSEPLDRLQNLGRFQEMSGKCLGSSDRTRHDQHQGGNTVLRSVFRAPREREGSATVNTAECGRLQLNACPLER